MLSSSEIKKLIRAGASNKILLVFIEILERRGENVKSKSNANLTNVKCHLTRKSNAEYQKEYRKRMKNKENIVNALDGVKSNDLTRNLTQENTLHIKNARTYVDGYTLSFFPNNEESKKVSKKEKIKKEISYTEEFNEFYLTYPKNPGSKKDAFEIFDKFLKAGVSHETIIRGAREYKNYIESTGSYVAHATTWLNQRRWESDYEVKTRTGGNSKETKHDSVINAISEALADHRAATRQPDG